MAARPTELHWNVVAKPAVGMMCSEQVHEQPAEWRANREQIKNQSPEHPVHISHLVPRLVFALFLVSFYEVPRACISNPAPQCPMPPPPPISPGPGGTRPKAERLDSATDPARLTWPKLALIDPPPTQLMGCVFCVLVVGGGLGCFSPAVSYRHNYIDKRHCVPLPLPLPLRVATPTPAPPAPVSRAGGNGCLTK
jgi:hypothetical protein